MHGMNSHCSAEPGLVLHEGKTVLVNSSYADGAKVVYKDIEYTGYSMIRTIQLLRKYSDKISNINDVIQFWKKTEIFNTEKRNNNLNDIDLENQNSEDEEFVDTHEELRKFIIENISNYFIEKNKSTLLNDDIFSDCLEKTVDGNEKHSLSFLFKQFYDSGLENGKIDSNDILRSININETLFFMGGFIYYSIKLFVFVVHC